MPSIVEARSLVAVRALVGESPASLVAVEVTEENVAPVRMLVREICDRYPRAAVVAMHDTGAVAAEGLFREAGAVDCVTSVLQLPRVARLAVRLAASMPDGEASMEELVVQMLPWPALATAEWAAPDKNQF